MVVYHNEQYHRREASAVSEFMVKGEIDKLNLAADNWSVPELLQKVLDTSKGKVTTNLVETLKAFENCEHSNFMQIGGPPGIGKSFLLKEIAHMWGKKEVLKSYKLAVLLNLGDPCTRQASEIGHLLKLCTRSRHTEATEITTCIDYLMQSDGKDILFILDGVNDSDVLQKNGLIADIVQRRILPCSGLIAVASSSHASLYLQQKATIIVDILGFTKQERMHFIKKALDGQPQKTEEVAQYLRNHCKINSLCYIPFYMNVLLFLYNQGILLSNNPAKLYECFIYLTIRRHHAKQGNSLTDTKNIDLAQLPDPYNNKVKQFSKFSLALNNNRSSSVFTLDEVAVACTDIASVLAAMNELGLLHSVPYFGLTGEAIHYHFLHLSIMEFLAVHYISNYSTDEGFKKKFWSSITFDSYITLAKGQHPSFKEFLTEDMNTENLSHILDNSLKCIHLFCNFYAAGNNKMCRLIESAPTFSNNTIDLKKIRLSAIDVECLTFFLTHSTQKLWEKLNLYDCNICDCGLLKLYNGVKIQISPFENYP